MESDYIEIKWKDINGTFGRYKISNTGIVIDTNTNEEKEHSVDKNGYHSVGIRIDGNNYGDMVHRLVAKHFIPNVDNKPQINHIDADKGNNYYKNLEWCTPQENMNHVSDNRLNPRSEWCCLIDKNEIKEVYVSMSKCARLFDMRPIDVSVCCNGRQDSSFGFKFRYYDEFNNEYVKTRFDNGSSMSKGKYRRKIRCIETGYIAKTQTEMAKNLMIGQVGISQVLNNKRESYKGYTFEYVTK